MDERFSRILSESKKLFLKYGIRNISMDDICRELGISKKTLYQYVENKADLIQKGLQKLLESSEARMKEGENKGQNAIEQLLEQSRCAFTSMKDFNPSSIFELQKYYPEIYREFLSENKKLIYSSMIRNISKGIEEGLYRSDLDTNLIATLYLQQLEVLNNPDTFQSGEFRMDEMFRAIFDSHIRAIANARGLRFYENKIGQVLPENPQN